MKKKIENNNIPKLGCYNSPPLEIDFVLEVSASQQLRTVHTPLHFWHSGSPRTLSLLPPDFKCPNHLVTQGLCLLITDEDRRLT